jgi:predicted nucleic acid-binding Zn ribbon protein
MTEKRKKKPATISDVVKSVLSANKIGDRIRQAHIIPDWASLVGPQIAKVTEPLSITPQGTLFVAVQTNAWMTELSLLEPELLKKLNVKTGRLSIKRIRWQIQRK